MSGVDVLSVMDKLTGRYIANKGTDSQFISCITPQCFGTDAKLRESDIGAAWLDLDEARAAVAELLEAAKESQTAWESFYANDGENGSTIRLSAAFHREYAALARCKGGAK